MSKNNTEPQPQDEVTPEAAKQEQSSKTEQPSETEQSSETEQPSEAEQIKKLQDDLLRARAENQNIAKRMRADIGRAELRGIEKVLAGMLTIADSLEQALTGPTDNQSALRDGVSLTLAAFNNVLTSNGMEIIDPEPGTALDPHLHMAIGSETQDKHPDNSVIRVILKGYRHNQRILRPAHVVVAETATAEKDAPNVSK